MSAEDITVQIAANNLEAQDYTEYLQYASDDFKEYFARQPEKWEQGISKIVTHFPDRVEMHGLGGKDKYCHTYAKTRHDL
jgi:hypothetical protein